MDIQSIKLISKTHSQPFTEDVLVSLPQVDISFILEGNKMYLIPINRIVMTSIEGK